MALFDVGSARAQEEPQRLAEHSGARRIGFAQGKAGSRIIWIGWIGSELVNGSEAKGFTQRRKEKKGAKNEEE